MRYTPCHITNSIMSSSTCLFQMVTVGELPLRVGLPIGEGAYARVVGAFDHEGLEVAIKEMRCGQGAGILPDASVQRAAYEVQVMKRLTKACEESELRVPKLLDHQRRGDESNERCK